MRVIIEIDEAKAKATDVEDLLYEIEHVVRKYEDFTRVRIERAMVGIAS